MSCARFAFGSGPSLNSALEWEGGEVPMPHALQSHCLLEYILVLVHFPVAPR